MVLAKKYNLNVISFLGLTAYLQEIQRTDNTVIKMSTLGNSPGQVSLFLLRINCVEKERERERKPTDPES